MEAFKKEYLNDMYQAGLVTVAAVGVSMVVKKVSGQSLAAPASLKETAKLALAVALGTIVVKKAQDKKVVPTNILA